MACGFIHQPLPTSWGWIMLRLRSKSYAPSLLMVMLCLGAWLTSLALLRPDVSPCRDALCPCCPETVAHSSKASVLLSILFYFSKKSGSIHFRSTILYVRKRKKISIILILFCSEGPYKFYFSCDNFTVLFF